VPRFVPLIVTDVPVGPLVGVKLVIVGLPPAQHGCTAANSKALSKNKWQPMQNFAPPGDIQAAAKRASTGSEIRFILTPDPEASDRTVDAEARGL